MTPSNPATKPGAQRAAAAPRIIAIAGGSGAGKTTLARHIVQHLGDALCSVLSQDSYYIDQSHRFDRDGGEVNFDHPSAIDFALLAEHLQQLQQAGPIDVPRYDFAAHKRLPTFTTLIPTAVVLVEGTLVLTQSHLLPFYDVSVFLQANTELRFSRRLQRDVHERGRQPEGVRRQFLRQVQPMHEAFVEPSKINASHILQQGDSYATVLAELRRLLGPMEASQGT